MPCSLPSRSRVVMIVTPVAKEPRALRSSRVLKPSAEVLCTVALWLPGRSFGTLTSSTFGLGLERRIGRQAERDATVHGAVDIPIQNVVRVGRVRIAERALQGVACVDSAAAGGREQDIDRLSAERGGEGAIAAIAGAV